MKNFWDERFSSGEYIYGTEPNDFFRSVIDGMPPGKLLLPGEGEGRNAVYAARLGWDVTAIDQSIEGKIKAEKLAADMSVNMDYRIRVLPGMEMVGQYDMAGVVFVHFQPVERKKFHEELVNALKPGGFIVMEVFHKAQIANTSGGPRHVEMLYSLEDIKEDFGHCEMIVLEHKRRMLEEGNYHKGQAEVIRMVARKKR